MRPLRAALALSAALTLALIPVGAFADTLYTTDTAGDVVVGPASATTTAPAPTRENGDIVRTTIMYGKANLRIKIRERDIVKVGSAVDLVSVKSDQGYRSIQLLTRAGHYTGALKVVRANGHKVRCGASWKIDYTANTVQIVVPRSCLDKPRWVKVGIGVVTSDDGFTTLYGDDARTNGTVGNSDPKFSPRIYR